LEVIAVLHYNNPDGVIHVCVLTLASGCFRGFSEKEMPKRTWLCMGISPLLYGLRLWLNCQKMRQVF